jgi:hypothetical protein
MKGFIYLGFLIILFACDENITTGTMEVENEKREKFISSIVDTLLFSKESEHNFLNNDSVIDKNRDLFVSELIRRIDSNQKVKQVSPINHNIRSSSFPMDENFVGVKVICFLNIIITSDNHAINLFEEEICKECKIGYLKRNGSKLELKDLENLKLVYESWYMKTKKLSHSQGRMVWMEDYNYKLDSILLNWR